MDAIPDIVDVVLWVLALLSIMSWTIMFYKAYRFWRIERGNQDFLENFCGLSHIRELPKLLSTAGGTVAQICTVGMDELQALGVGTSSTLDARDRRDILHHAMRQQVHLEQSRLENGLAVLASVGSTSPFIGLFGTVWGIMHALKSISASGSAGLDVVAGPIGEALIATAMGIAAAIPAVLAYNYFLRRVRLNVTSMEHFVERFQHLVIKSGLGGL